MSNILYMRFELRAVECVFQLCKEYNRGMFLSKFALPIVFFGLLLPTSLNAQAQLVPDTVTIHRAVVREVFNQHQETIPGTDTSTNVQTLQAEILDGPDAGRTVTFENDYIQLESGDSFFIRHTSNSLDDREAWSVADPDRLYILALLVLMFLVLLIIFGGIQGVRGLTSLLGSLVLIFYLLLPGILHGYSPILVSIGVASLIIMLGSYITHGFNKTTTAAVLGMLATVVLTGLGAYALMQGAHLSGYAAEESIYLNFDTRGAIDMAGLLFGGIMIGLLGVLYDIAIGQAIAVEELFAAGQHYTRAHVYQRAIRIGREHIGALVNTLAIAYVGVALPLLLLVLHSVEGDLLFLINREVFATELIRILIGSIGLIVAVPITTLIASRMLGDSAPQGGR